MAIPETKVIPATITLPPKRVQEMGADSLAQTGSWRVLCGPSALAVRGQGKNILMVLICEFPSMLVTLCLYVLVGLSSTFLSELLYSLSSN